MNLSRSKNTNASYISGCEIFQVTEVKAEVAHDFGILYFQDEAACRASGNAVQLCTAGNGNQSADSACESERRDDGEAESQELENPAGYGCFPNN